jgi:two-component system KDP operon response regulator KdpE
LVKEQHSPTMTERVLLIDDDVRLCELLTLMLTSRGFKVEVAYDAISGLQKAYALHPDAILLDVMMPGMDGWEACRRLREMSDVPILMLTALNSTEKVVRGLEMGADDYLVKPVTADVLAARLRAQLRRMSQASLMGELSPIFKYDKLIIDFDKHEVTVDDQRVDLSPTEFRLLAVLARNHGRVLPHTYLLREVWGPEYMSAVDYLRLYITYLRQKIEENPGQPSLIHTEWGVGYRFE